MSHIEISCEGQSDDNNRILLNDIRYKNGNYKNVLIAVYDSCSGFIVKVEKNN